MGCAVVDALLGIQDPEEVKADKQWQQNQVRAAELESGIDREPGNYRLTFDGEPPGPWAGSFEPVNRTPAMLTATAFTARETNKFSSGDDPKTAVQAVDTWVIDAKRDGNRIEGTAKFVRWRDEGRVQKIVNQETGEVRYEAAPPGAYPSLTVTWEGALKAVVADDGTIAGTVEGTFSNSEGFSKPFKWEFAGDPIQ
jgi:hypothetical protein